MNNNLTPNTSQSNILDASPNNDARELVYRRHPINLATPAMITIFMLSMIIFSTIFILTSDIVDLGLYLSYVVLYSGILIFLALSYFFMNWTFWYLDVWIITASKLIDSQLITFFVRRRAELALEQIQDIRFTIPGTLATIFSCGNILIQSAAKEGNFRLMFIPNPREAVIEINRIIKNVRTSAQKPVVLVGQSSPTMRLGEELIKSNLLSVTNLDTALAQQAQSGKRLGEILLEKGLLNKKDLVTALSSQYRLPEVNLRRYNFDLEVINYLTSDIATKNLAIPISKTSDGVLMAIADPSSDQIIENIRAHLDMPVDFAIADETDIKWAIQKYYNPSQISGQNSNLNPDSNQSSSDN